MDDKYASNLKMFKNYFIYYTSNALKILNKDLKLVFSVKIIQDENELFGIIIINDESIGLVYSDKVRLMHLKEEKTDQFTYEIIQEMKETEFYCLGNILNNGYLLLAGGDRKYRFYDLEKNDQKFGKNNIYKLIGNIEKVHNV